MFTQVRALSMEVIVGERSNFKKIPTHTQDHGDALEMEIKNTR